MTILKIEKDLLSNKVQITSQDHKDIKSPDSGSDIGCHSAIYLSISFAISSSSISVKKRSINSSSSSTVAQKKSVNSMMISSYNSSISGCTRGPFLALSTTLSKLIIWVPSCCELARQVLVMMFSFLYNLV